MELLHVDELGTRSPRDGKTMKQLFGEKSRNFEELTSLFTFYTPVVHHLIRDMSRTAIATDMISHTLALAMQEHPLVVIDLPRPVFRFSDSLLLAEQELKSFGNTLYAVPTEQWNQVHARLGMISVVDPVTHRFCILASHVREIPNPIGQHDDLLLPVWFFSCYGNRETYYFQQEHVASGSENGVPQVRAEVPVLCYHHPIREIVELADRTLALLAETTQAEREKVMPNTAAAMESAETIPQLLAMQQQNELHRKIATPLKESSLSEQYIRQCRNIIRLTARSDRRVGTRFYG